MFESFMEAYHQKVVKKKLEDGSISSFFDLEKNFKTMEKFFME